MLISIGQFSSMVRLSVKALRLYADKGILLPAHIDTDTGYRYYKTSQAKQAEIIRLLRSVEMPLDEIRLVLAAEQSEDALEKLLVHRQRMEERLKMQERMLTYLESLIQNKERIMPYQITVTPATPQTIAGIRMHTSMTTIKADIGQGFARIMQGINQQRYTPSGPPMLLYHDVIDQDNAGEIEVCIPVVNPFNGGEDFQCHELNDDHIATTVHHGPYEELASAYHSMHAWINEHDYELAGSPREIYLNDPNVTHPDNLQTKLEFPVRQRTAGTSNS